MTRVAVPLFHGTSLFENAVPLRVFGAVPGVGVDVIAEDGGSSIAAAGGLTVTTPANLDALAAADLVVIPSYRTPPDEPPPAALSAAVRAAHERGAAVAGLCLGAFVLAATGLLDGRAATTHWEQAGLLARRHPSISVHVDSLYVEDDDGRLLTSAGSAAGLDACLHLVRRRFGAAEANRVARNLVVAPHRDGGQAQYVEHPVPEPGRDPIGGVLAYLLDRLDREHGVDALAAHARMSRRSFDRHFRAATGTTPARWLRHQRVLAAQRMLEGTVLPVETVARRCGYPNAAALRPHFAAVFGVSPAAYRRGFGRAADDIGRKPATPG